MNAETAREITYKNNDTEVLERIFKFIRKAAEKGDNKAKWRGEMLSQVGYTSHPPIVDRVIDHLIGLGYKVDLRFEERQFVDIYLEIEW